jgi:hypothetical protein
MQVPTNCNQERMRNAVGNYSTMLVRRMRRDVQECVMTSWEKLVPQPERHNKQPEKSSSETRTFPNHVGKSTMVAAAPGLRELLVISTAFQRIK